MAEERKSAIYGHLEHPYANAFAEALLANRQFREWVLLRTKFGGHSGTRVLLEEMRARRSKGTKYWWKNYFTESCRCIGCSGHETDVFAVLEDGNAERFALHIEIKQPTDRFSAGAKQGERYRARAECWAKTAPRNVPPHSDACTVLVCSEAKLQEFSEEIPWFDAVFTHEEIAQEFPEATALSPKAPSYASPFALGQRVFHGKFGYGTIAAIEGNKLEIDFEHAGRKKVLDSFVSTG